MDDDKPSTPKGGGSYIRQKDGTLVQVAGPTHDPGAAARQRYRDIEKPKDDALVANAIEALRALEARMKELDPGITNDRTNVLPEMATRWKVEGFPRVGLAVLFQMMKKGHSDLVAGASQWKIHRDTIQYVRKVYPEQYPGEPLRQALVEHGYSRYYHFPPPTSSTDTIDENFVAFAQQKVASLGEGTIKAHSGTVVRSQRLSDERRRIAERFHELHLADPDQFPRTGVGYAAAAAVLEDEGFKKTGKTKVEGAYTSSDLYLSAIMFGMLKSPKNNS